MGPADVLKYAAVPFTIGLDIATGTEPDVALRQGLASAAMDISGGSDFIENTRREIGKQTKDIILDSILNS